jgi:hypothetical protein
MRAACSLSRNLPFDGQTLVLRLACATHTFNVTGLEVSVRLTGGPVNTDVPVQAWVS